MYINAPEPISTVYFTNPSHQSVYLYVHLPIVARQRLGKCIPNFLLGNEYTQQQKNCWTRVCVSLCVSPYGYQVTTR
jgi:hypothetical protein